MSSDWWQSVYDWHKLCAPDRIGTTPEMPSPGIEELTFDLVDEEFTELNDALDDHHLPSIADSIGDLIFVLLGLAISWGIDMRPVMDAIIAANMTKATGPVRADGKREKPPGFKHPDIAGILANQPSIQEHS